MASHLKLKSDKCVKTSVGKRVRFPFSTPREKTHDNKGKQIISTDQLMLFKMMFIGSKETDAMPSNRDPANTGADLLSEAHPTQSRGLLH